MFRLIEQNVDFFNNFVQNVDDLENRIHNMNNSENEQDTQLSWNIDFQKIQSADQYQIFTLLFEKEESKFLTTEFDITANDEIIDNDDDINIDSISFMSFSQSRRSFDDFSEIISQSRIRNENSNHFVLALDLWCEKIDVFRSQYFSFREILKMLKSHRTLNRLSISYDSFKRRIKDWLSQLQFRRALLSLNVDKMSFLAKQQKQNKNNIAAMTKEHLYFFDSVDFFQKILMSKLAQKMHFEFDEFKIDSVELWQFSSWTAFVRIISENYARYRNDDLIFSSN